MLELAYIPTDIGNQKDIQLKKMISDLSSVDDRLIEFLKESPNIEILFVENRDALGEKVNFTSQTVFLNLLEDEVPDKFGFIDPKKNIQGLKLGKYIRERTNCYILIKDWSKLLGFLWSNDLIDFKAGSVTQLESFRDSVNFNPNEENSNPESYDCRVYSLVTKAITKAFYRIWPSSIDVCVLPLLSTKDRHKILIASLENEILSNISMVVDDSDEDTSDEDTSDLLFDSEIEEIQTHMRLKAEFYNRFMNYVTLNDSVVLNWLITKGIYFSEDPSVILYDELFDGTSKSANYLHSKILTKDSKRKAYNYYVLKFLENSFDGIKDSLKIDLPESGIEPLSQNSYAHEFWGFMQAIPKDIFNKHKLHELKSYNNLEEIANNYAGSLNLYMESQSKAVRVMLTNIVGENPDYVANFIYVFGVFCSEVQKYISLSNKALAQDTEKNRCKYLASMHYNKYAEDLVLHMEDAVDNLNKALSYIKAPSIKSYTSNVIATALNSSYKHHDIFVKNAFDFIEQVEKLNLPVSEIQEQLKISFESLGDMGGLFEVAVVGDLVESGLTF